MRLRLLLVLYQQDPSPIALDYCITGWLDRSLTALAINSPLSSRAALRGGSVFVCDARKAREKTVFRRRGWWLQPARVPPVGAHENLGSGLLCPSHTPHLCRPPLPPAKVSDVHIQTP